MKYLYELKTIIEFLILRLYTTSVKFCRRQVLSCIQKGTFMNTIEFTTRFSNEQNCKEYFASLRREQGVICKNCGCTNHYWLASKWQFQCSRCNFRTTLKSGTIMENSRLSFQKWFWIFYLMTQTKKGLSACELQRQVGHQRYATIWSIMHRIREKMGKRDNKYLLKGMVEFDEAYFEKAVSKSIKASLKRGRGSKRQQNVAVMAESFPLENDEGKPQRYCGFFKMTVLPNSKTSSIDSVIRKSIERQTIVFSDKSTSYVNISNYVDVHVSEKSTKQTTQDLLKWVHIAISNAKRTLLGIFHKINGKYLQNYLDEFTYKLNRRHSSNLFHRLLVAVVN